MDKFLSTVILIILYTLSYNKIIDIPIICIGLAWYLFIITLVNDISNHLLIRQQIIEQLEDINNQQQNK